MATITKIRPDETDTPDVLRGHRLRQLLKAQRWSVNAASAETHIPRSTLYERVKGASPLQFHEIELLAPLTGMTPVDLFHDLLHASENPHQSPDGGSEPPVGLEPTTCSLQGDHLGEVIDMFTWKSIA